MHCEKCHDTEGPFIADIKSGKVLCEDCYIYNDIVDKCISLIQLKSGKTSKSNLNVKAVTMMDSIQTSVFDKLGIK